MRTGERARNLAIPALSALVVAVLVGCGQDQPKPTEQAEREASTAACQEAVGGKLDSPNTAQFSSSAKRSTDDDERWHFWTISGHVDSHRLDASAVRTQFVCEVTWQPTTQLTDVTSVQVSEDE